MTDAGLRVRSDGMGNIFGRWEGTHPAERASHAGRSERSLPPLTLMLGCFAAGQTICLTPAGQDLDCKTSVTADLTR